MGDHYGGRPGHRLPVGPDEPARRLHDVDPVDVAAVAQGAAAADFAVYTTHGFGAAGLGWDLPLSYVLVDSSLAHRRPTNSPTPCRRPLPMSRSRSADRIFGARSARHGLGRPQRQRDGDADGFGRELCPVRRHGRTWTFTRDDDQERRLGIWTLKTIAGAGGSLVTFNYDYPTVAAGTGTALTIDLTSIVYNKHPSTTCEKNQIVFTYDAPSANALSVWTIRGRRLWARAQADRRRSRPRPAARLRTSSFAAMQN